MSFLNQPITDIFIRPARTIADIKLQVVVNEHAVDTLTVTKQPVQQGASITDHAYMEPTTFSHSIYFTNNNIFGGTTLSQIYEQLRTLQSSAVPFDIVTPKRIYKSMLMTSLTQTTDKLTENCLSIAASYQQVILVPVTAMIVERSRQKNAGKTGATQPAGKKSAARTLVDGITAAFSKAGP